MSNRRYLVKEQKYSIADYYRMVKVGVKVASSEMYVHYWFKGNGMSQSWHYDAAWVLLCPRHLTCREALSDAAFRLCVRVSVCQFVYPMPIWQKRCILGIIHCIQEKKRQTEIYYLKYLLQNSGDSDEIWYTVSWILLQTDLNVSYLTWIMSLHCPMKLEMLNAHMLPLSCNTKKL